METKVCTKCKVGKEVSEFKKRSDSDRLLSACIECERKRSSYRMKTARGTPEGAYAQHKSNAKQRGIEFLLSFSEWMGVWQASGKWDLRGKGSNSYCMMRHGDVGPYEVGNVSIGTNAKNISDGNLGKINSDEHNARISTALAGRPKQWVAGDKNPMHRPEVKAKVSEAIGGAKHYMARGVSTPHGIFATAKEAALAIGIPKPTVEWRCKNEKFGFSYIKPSRRDNT